MSDFLGRLEKFLSKRETGGDVEQLTPDASTREYFRIGWKGGSAIACVYPETFDAAEQNYLDVTRLFSQAGLPVAKVLDFDAELGVIVQEDLGSRILRDVLVDADDATCEELVCSAVALIPRIQTATRNAYELDSIASRLRFDTEKLLWELEFFRTHYFTTYKNEPMSAEEDAKLTSEFVGLARELESKARVLCHRDFHAANLMLDQDNRLRIIDHQDARIGSVAYDLVSLLLDRVTVPPAAEWLADKRRFFLSERESLGLEQIDERAFADEFRLQTIQRCLKAIGTFSFQSVNRGKTYFVPFIKPMFQIVLRAVQNLDRYPTIAKVVANEIEKN
ncbi:MAG: phosphotransferase [Blastocatellia bacterium]|nr:phosphotransferase [Blastocatellia bacterium]